MKWLRNSWLLLLTAALGCAAGSDGGVVGSGISSVSGNVIDVQTDDPAATATAAVVASLALPSVSVRVVEAPGIATDVNPTDGTFELQGDFSGALTLEFATSGGTSTLSVDVPEGSAVVLEDIRILLQQVFVRRNLVHFDGHASAVDCENGVVHMIDEARQSHPFDVKIGADTEVVDGDGQDVRCADIHAGDRLDVDAGLVQAPDVAGGPPLIDAVRIAVNRQAGPPDTIPMRRIGNLVQVACGETGTLRLQDSKGQFGDVFGVQLIPTTQFMCAESQPCPHGCSDLSFGSDIEVRGVSPHGRPDVIRALVVIVHGRPANFAGHLDGVVKHIDCGAGLLRVDDPRFDDREPPVQLTAATEIKCNPGKSSSCQCSDIRAGDHVQVDAIVSAGAPITIQAYKIRLDRVMHGHGMP